MTNAHIWKGVAVLSMGICLLLAGRAQGAESSKKATATKTNPTPTKAPPAKAKDNSTDQSVDTSIDPEMVPVAKGSSDHGEFDEINSKKEASKPQELSSKDKAATIKRVRRLAGVEKTNLQAVPPATIQLSPDNIRKGKSWLGMLKGAIRPGITDGEASYMTIGPNEGVFLLHFEPVMKSSPYLLDCEVSAFPKGKKIVWEVHGAFNGIVEDQSGHLLIGFIATENVARLSISRSKGLILGHLFKCELTRVD